MNEPAKLSTKDRPTEDARKETLRVWLRLLACTTLIKNNLRTRLRVRYQTTLPRFDVLAALYREDEPVPIGALPPHLMVSGGNVTAIVLRLERSGLIERWPAPEDRRKNYVKLSAKGRRRFATMAKEHQKWVSSALSCLSSDEIREFARILTKLSHHLGHKTER